MNEGSLLQAVSRCGRRVNCFLAQYQYDASLRFCVPTEA